MDEAKLERLLELQEAAEARRQNWRRALPWIGLVVVLVAVIVPVVIHQRQEAAAERCAASQVYWDMLGEPESAPDC